MFSIFNSQQEYYSCEWLEYGIHFSPLGIEQCCMYVPNSDAFKMLTPLKNGEYDISKFYKNKEEIIKQHKKGVINPNCSKCYNFKQAKWAECKYIKYLVLNLSYHCNSDCIYCYTHKYKKLYNKSVDVPILNILKDFINKKKLFLDCEIHIGGGEPVLNKEFEKIVNLFIENGFKNIKIYSSGIQYSSIIEKALNNNGCKLIVSPDCGDSILYKVIKNVDKFDQFWKNIKKYCEVQNEDKYSVMLKYIIIPSINDNKESIDNFLNKVDEVNGKFIVVDIEREWYSKNKNNNNEIMRILKLIKYIQLYADNNRMRYEFFPACVYAINDYSSFYNGLNNKVLL